MKKLKIFITGGAGFIGSHLTEKLIANGHSVAIFDAFLNFTDNDTYYGRCMSLRKLLFKHFPKIYSGDIRNLNQLSKAVKDFNPDIIIHLAGLPMARIAEKYSQDMISINLYGTMNVLSVFEKSNASKIIYTSSSMVYGHFINPPLSEDTILNPENYYGATKAAGEYFVKLSRKEWVIIRPTSVYGFTDCANRVTQLLIDSANRNRPAWIISGETLDFSYIDDVVDGFVTCVTNSDANKKIFNISRGEGRSVLEFAQELKKYYPKFDFEIREADEKQVWRGSLDITRAKEILNFNPKYDIKKGIAAILKQIDNYNFYNY